MTLATQDVGSRNRIRHFLDDPVRILMVAEGSGGHVIPALEITRVLLDAGALVTLLYPRRPQVASLLAGLTRDLQDPAMHLQPFSLSPCPLPIGRPLWRLGQAGSIWRLAQERLQQFRPDVVVGFGGWLSVPVILAAGRQDIPTLVHEQNVQLGRANRFLLDWTDQLAVSFEATRRETDNVPVVMSGMPVRASIGTVSREAAAQQLELRADLPTVLVLGGSQGSHALNQLLLETTRGWTPQERREWQLVHIAGAQDEPVVRAAYAELGLQAVVRTHLTEMAAGYAMADVVIARAGASTVSELAQCGKPAILIPYPHAGGHQRANAQVIEAVGAGVMLEEHLATPARVLGTLRRMLQDERLRQMMGRQMATLTQPAATQRLARAILTLAAVHRDTAA